MMQQFNVAVLLLTDNCAGVFGATVDSIRLQTFDPERIKIVAVDNCSEDGTYELLLESAIKTNLAVYRLRKQVFPTRLLRAALLYLRFTDYKYLLILNPGDILDPRFISRCVEVMETHSKPFRSVLLCEANVIDERGKRCSQPPLYTDSCILARREHYNEFFVNGPAHRIQAFYLTRSIPLMLPELPFCTDHTDWFSKALYAFNSECLYLKEPLATVRVSPPKCRVYQLMLRSYLVNRLDLVRGTVYSSVKMNYLDRLDVSGKINENLAMYALRHAREALAAGDTETAEKILLYAEMVYDEITKSRYYDNLVSFLRSESGSVLPEPLDNETMTVRPPEKAIII